MNRYRELKWIVECKPAGQLWYEPICAWNSDRVAIGYAEDCIKTHSSAWSYRVVTKAGKVLATFGKDAK